MNKSLIYIFLIILISCSHKTKQDEIDYGTTEELQQQNADVMSFKSNRGNNIVEHLYGEAIEKDPTLKSLENQMLKINNSIQDSLLEFNEYVEYNNLYYQSAQSYIHSLRDSLKRKKLLTYFNDSKEKLEIKIDEQGKVHGKISELNNDLRDQHTIMKLIVSEKLIDAYQNKEPKIETLQSIDEQLKNLISESKKYSTPKK